MKLAKEYGVEQLLPPGRKSTTFRDIMVYEKGLRIKGTGIGEKVKGHKWERTLNVRLEERRQAMLNMPEMIRAWKQVSYSLIISIPKRLVLTRVSFHSVDTDEAGRSIRRNNGRNPLLVADLHLSLYKRNPHAERRYLVCLIYLSMCKNIGFRIRGLAYPFAGVYISGLLLGESIWIQSFSYLDMFLPTPAMQ